MLKAKQRGKTQYILESRDGHALRSPTTFSTRYFNKVGKKLGFTHRISSHTARHTLLTHLVSDGKMPLPAIAQLAGHVNIETLIKVYTHPILDPDVCTIALTNIYDLDEEENTTQISTPPITGSSLYPN